MKNIDSRREVLRKFGATESVIDELLEYTTNDFQVRKPTEEDVSDEHHIEAWRTYARDAEASGTYQSLRKRLVQLSFPIEEGISRKPAYVASVQRGEPPPDQTVSALDDQDNLRLEIHPSAAGNIPLLITSSRAVFVSLVQALTRRNEPVIIPDAMGACMIAGYNNWDRIRAYRQRWEIANPGSLWSDEFPRFRARKAQYQDRFIILSEAPYSGVEAHVMDLPSDVWRAASLIIRREHECTHYFTKRIFGSMRNNVFDELIADYVGIVEVCGRFRADWFLRFMGLENFPTYRNGARFEHYVCGLSRGARTILMRLLIKAAFNLEADSLRVRPRFDCSAGKTEALCALATMTLEGIAALEHT